MSPGSTTECPQLFPGSSPPGVAPHGAAKYDFDANNPSTTKFPPYYDDSFFLGEFNADTLREISSTRRTSLQDQRSSAAARRLDDAAFPFECDNPMDMQFGKDGYFYLLTYGDGFFDANPDAGMYRWDYVKGPRAPKTVMRPTRPTASRR